MATKKTSETPEGRVQAAADIETEQGFRGVKADPTPNENYTVAGVTSGAPTPETDDGAADAARASLTHLADENSQ